MQDTLLRIQNMEEIYDMLRLASPGDVRYRHQLEQLAAYYESPEWRRDYEADEEGLLPRELKRGVLSQDGVYNLLDAWSAASREERDMRWSAESSFLKSNSKME